MPDGFRALPSNDAVGLGRLTFLALAGILAPRAALPTSFSTSDSATPPRIPDEDAILVAPPHLLRGNCKALSF
jgi:hypothetical protein